MNQFRHYYQMDIFLYLLYSSEYPNFCLSWLTVTSDIWPTFSNSMVLSSRTSLYKYFLGLTEICTSDCFWKFASSEYFIIIYIRWFLNMILSLIFSLFLSDSQTEFLVYRLLFMVALILWLSLPLRMSLKNWGLCW